MLGYGAVFPFEIIYLHEARGFSLGVAGLVVGLVTGVAVVVAPVAGAVIDRVGARTTAVGAGLALAGGYGSLAFATTPAVAFAAAALAGVGNGGLIPSQSALMAALAPRELRQRASAVSRVAVNVGIGLGAAIGGLVAGFGLNGFVVLFLANAVTYLLYLAILVAAVRDDARPEPVAGGYRQVLRDRAFLRFALTNVAMIAVGWGVLAWIVPPYARELGIAPSLIGLLLLANAATVVLAQLPIVKAAEGRSRVGALSLGAGTWVVACLLAVVAQAGSPSSPSPAWSRRRSPSASASACTPPRSCRWSPTWRRPLCAVATWRPPGCRGGSGSPSPRRSADSCWRSRRRWRSWPARRWRPRRSCSSARSRPRSRSAPA